MNSSWYQTVLVDVEVIEVNIRLGIVPSSDHIQVLVEAKDPRTNVLLAQASMPHSPITHASEMLVWALDRAAEMVAELADPF